MLVSGGGGITISSPINRSAPASIAVVAPSPMRCRLLRCRLFAWAQDRQCAVDSVPVARSADDWRPWGADFGKVCTKKQTIFGYKLHLLVTLSGMIRDFVLAPASVHDIAVAPELLGGQEDRVVSGDTGYVSTPLTAALQQERGVTLLTPRRRNQQERSRLFRLFRPLLHGISSLYTGSQSSVLSSCRDTQSSPAPCYTPPWVTRGLPTHGGENE